VLKVARVSEVMTAPTPVSEAARESEVARASRGVGGGEDVRGGEGIEGDGSKAVGE
jgi:hypothetical protein